MRAKQKTVYYCDFCGKRRLLRPAMEKHELHCTMNPNRVCRWELLEYKHMPTHAMRKGIPRWLQLRAPLGTEDIEALREKVEQCPACMLSALRLSGLEYHYNHKTGLHLFSYEKEIEDWREAWHERELQEEYWSLQASWI